MLTAETVVWTSPPKPEFHPLIDDRKPPETWRKADVSATDYDGILIELRKHPGQPARVQVARKSRSSVNTWKVKGADAVARRNAENPLLFDVYAWWPETRPNVPASKRPSGVGRGRPRLERDDSDEPYRLRNQGPSKIEIEYTAVPAVVRNPNLPPLPSSPFITDDGSDPRFTYLMRERRRFEADRRARGIPPEGLAPIQSRLTGQIDFGTHHNFQDNERD